MLTRAVLAIDCGVAFDFTPMAAGASRCDLTSNQWTHFDRGKSRLELCESKLMEAIDHGRLFQDDKLVPERTGRTKDPKLMEESESMGDNPEHLKEWRLLDGASQVFDREKNRLINYISIFPTTVRRVRCEI